MNENPANRPAVALGSLVRLVSPRWDRRTATVAFVFRRQDEAYLSPPLENRSIWKISELVLVEGR